LQPLFENAIRHGASRMTGPCEIGLCASCKAETLDITIRNDGPRCAAGSAPPQFGVGLTNTMDRLKIHYGDCHLFLYSDRPEGGVQIRISIPYSEAGDGAAVVGSIRESPSAEDPINGTQPAAPTIGYT
jgi:two-component system, LytTR family, sensor histidine kinase AlgZ